MSKSSKSRVDKSFFEWASHSDSSADITDAELEKAYKLDLDVCKSKSNKNCSQNPRCLNGLGEKAWLSDFDDKCWQNIEDPNNDLRTKDMFVGLKNLGATCYVNSLLQVWFQNPFLRHAIYKWRPEEDPEENESHSNLLESSDSQEIHYFPVSSVGRLQLIFGFMQFGLRCSVDPSPIIKCLKLDESQQQDAHEFCNLFITHIEKKLNFQSDKKIKKIIESQYCGRCAYITRCQKCGDGSRKESQFYELDLGIKGCKDIFDCLTEYLKEESLEGNNQYYCEKCKCKQNAKRFIELQKLPPFLTLQLLRFIYDPQKGGKKKLNSFLHFPDTIDMKPYINSLLQYSNEETTYHLSAVLIHRGPSAHSGHYIAHIKDRITGFWYKFNDEKVEKIEGKKLKLDSDDGNDDAINGSDINLGKSKDKSSHYSNNAYMLVYKNETQQSSNLTDNFDDWDVPQYLREAIIDDNNKFQQIIAELELKRNIHISEIKNHQQEVKNIYESLSTASKESYAIISKSWLIDWLSSRLLNKLNPVDNSILLCPHQNLNFNSISSFKCISIRGADLIYEKYGGGPRIDKSMLCRQCISNQAILIKAKAKVDEDQKFITSQLKFTISQNEHCFWIGKESFRNWKSLKLNYITDKCFDKPILFSQDSNQVDLREISNSKCDNENSFNRDVLCEHGGLMPNADNRRLISAMIWDVFKRHFPNAPQFERDAMICQKCALLAAQLETDKVKSKESASIQKCCLLDLCQERRRLSWDDLSDQSIYYVLSRKFLKEWKYYINDSSKYDKPNRIQNGELLCPHLLFLYPLENMELNGDNSKFVVISSEEWDLLKDFYNFDYQIKINVSNLNGRKYFESTPSHCISCHESLILEEERDRFTYTNQWIYIRKIENNENLSDSTPEYSEETDLFQKSNKKLKKQDSTPSGGNHCLRRSSRRRKNKNEKEIKVSSTDTLKDLKVQIMTIFKVAPFDQHLSLNDKPLLCNEKTLAQLYIEPYCTITLKVDEEPTDDCTIIEDDYIKGSAPEIGFKGTQLQE